MKRIRGRINVFSNSKKMRKNNKTMNMIGLDKKIFGKWIKFNMIIDKIDKNNFHLDHFIPLSSFKCNSFDDIVNNKCHHWTNLVPTTPEYNLQKARKIPTLKEQFALELRIVIFKLKFL